jgi:hypothetical protein
MEWLEISKVRRCICFVCDWSVVGRKERMIHEGGREGGDDDGGKEGGERVIYRGLGTKIMPRCFIMFLLVSCHLVILC